MNLKYQLHEGLNASLGNFSSSGANWGRPFAKVGPVEDALIHITWLVCYTATHR